jgi:hypothetical protein
MRKGIKRDCGHRRERIRKMQRTRSAEGGRDGQEEGLIVSSWASLDPVVGRRVEREDVSEDEREGDESGEEAHHEDVEDRVLGDDLASLGSLLERVDRGTDLLRGSEPELKERERKERISR